jgi:HEAT repeat protein
LKNLQKVSPNPVILAIGKLGREARSAVPALVKLMEKDDPSWPFFSTDAIDALGEIGPEARTAVPNLIIQLRKSSESNRAHAAEALGRIGPGARAAVPELEKRLKDVRLRVRIWAAFALIRITGDSKRRMSLLISLWSKDEDLYLAEAFGMLGAEARPARDLLLQSLADEDTPSGILHRVARALGQFRDDADLIVPRLLALMELPAVMSGRNNGREYVIEALGLLGPSAKAAIPRLRVLAEDNDDVIARTAVRALEKIEGK